jgi:hypothetical protein
MLQANCKPAKVVLVGRYPPPYGGNTAHMERLVARLLADGRPLTVTDPYAMATGTVSQGEAGKTLTLRCKSRAGLLVALAVNARGAVVHMHMSAGGNFYRAAPFLLAAARAADKRVLSIHSGSWAKEFQALPPERQQAAVRLLGAFEDIICVNTEQEQALRSRVRSRLHVIPAYLPAVAASDDALPSEVKALRKEVDILAVTSGSGTPIYDFATVLQGVERAQSRLPERLGLAVVTYGMWDDDYWPPMAARLAGSAIPTVITKDLNPSQFVAVLSQAHLYLRGTLTDGDSISLREAASAGARVIASDAVPRPAGAVLFPTGNAACLAERLVEAVRDPRLGLLPTEAHADNYCAILRVYGTRCAA